HETGEEMRWVARAIGRGVLEMWWIGIFKADIKTRLQQRKFGYCLQPGATTMRSYARYRSILSCCAISHLCPKTLLLSENPVCGRWIIWKSLSRPQNPGEFSNWRASRAQEKRRLTFCSWWLHLSSG